MKNIIKINLKEILDTMDIPESRRDINKPENISWLLRNLGIRNKENKYFQDAVKLIKMLL